MGPGEGGAVARVLKHVEQTGHRISELKRSQASSVQSGVSSQTGEAPLRSGALAGCLVFARELSLWKL